MSTKVTRLSRQSNGQYDYYSVSEVWCSKSSALGGKKYQAGGYDYILQSIPKSLSKKSHGFYGVYFNGSTARHGKEYYSQSGGAQYQKIGIKDDPVGSKINHENELVYEINE